MDRTSLTKIPLHRQLTYLLVELGYQLLFALALLSMPGLNSCGALSTSCFFQVWIEVDPISWTE